jgi:hypothetical protein
LVRIAIARSPSGRLGSFPGTFRRQAIADDVAFHVDTAAVGRWVNESVDYKSLANDCLWDHIIGIRPLLVFLGPMGISLGAKNHISATGMFQQSL